jgi:hypothetical protein
MPTLPYEVKLDLTVKGGQLIKVIVDGEDVTNKQELNESEKDAIFASENGARYVGTILYHVNATTGTCCVIVHRNCRAVCKIVPCP